MGLIFEKMCKDYILFYDKNLPFPIGEIGQWWGGHPHTHKQAQIDIVVTSSTDDSAIIGSCKFRNEPVDEKELHLMEDYANAMGHFSRRYYYLFSKSGFKSSLTTLNGTSQVRLLTIGDLYLTSDANKGPL